MINCKLNDELTDLLEVMRQVIRKTAELRKLDVEWIKVHAIELELLDVTKRYAQLIKR